VPYAVNPDRVAAAERLQKEHSIDCLVLDDAFQHRRIARDLDLVLLDALAPFGHGHLFPRGLLRESLRSLARADLVLLSRADMVSGERIREITESVRRYAPSMQVVPITHQPRALAPWEGDAAPLDSFDGKSVLAFCGLGNPDGFRHTLHRLGMRPVGFETFPDHHEYNQADRSRLEQLARKQGADALVCTMKDLVKIQRNELAGLPLRAVEIGIGFPDGDAPLQEKIDRLFPRS
jgi:tetraacyldisaccharide 4'-kinase